MDGGNRGELPRVRPRGAALLGDTGIDAVLSYYVDLGRGEADAILAEITAAAVGSDKPVVANVISAGGQPAAAPEPVSAPRTRPVPNYPFPEACAAVIARGAQRRAWLSRPLGQAPELDRADAEAARALVAAKLTGRGEHDTPWLSSSDAERLLATFGLAVTGSRSMVGPGADILLGTVRDPALGPLIALGLGGRHAGLVATATFRLPPVTDVDADELITASPAVSALVEGRDGEPALDHDALRDAILRFAALVRAVPHIVEADLHPVRLMPAGLTVLEARLRLGRPPSSRRAKTW